MREESMEQEKDLSAKSYSRKPLESSSKDNGRVRTTFRGAARQVWIANALSKHHVNGVENDLKTSESNQKMPIRTAFEGLPPSSNRPPSIKRRATPDIFPMSSEMRKTLVLLGNLDLLPEEEKRRQEEQVQAEKKKKLNSFRQKTQMRVIQPQRIIRSFRNGGNSKIVSKNTSQLENTDTTAKSLINSTSSNAVNSTLSPTSDETGKNNDPVKLENISPSEEKDASEPQDVKSTGSLILNLSLRQQKSSGSAKNPWRRAVKRHQLGQVEPNPENPFFVRKRFHTTKKDFKFSKTWQPRSKLQEFPNIKRAKSFSPRGLSSELKDSNIINKVNYSEPINEGKSIDEITSDIQERCSKWFEFRQKILTKSRELEYS